MNPFKWLLSTVLCLALMSCELLTMSLLQPEKTSKVTLTVSPCDKVKSLKATELPQKIRDFLAENYPGQELTDIDLFRVNNLLAFGIELDKELHILFDEDGLVISSAKSTGSVHISLDALPVKTTDYLTKHFGSYTIVKAEWKSHFGTPFYEIYLSNNQEVYFDKDGNFRCLDDSSNDDSGKDDKGNDDNSGDDNGDDHGGDDNSGSGNNNGGTSTPPNASAAINAYVAANYSAFSIDKIKEDDLCNDFPVIKVELKGPGEDPELIFDRNGKLLFVAFDITQAMLPAAVTKTITAKYPGYNFVGDDLERHVYPDNSIQYKAKLRHPSTQDKVELVLSADGRILCEDD